MSGQLLQLYSALFLSSCVGRRKESLVHTVCTILCDIELVGENSTPKCTIEDPRKKNNWGEPE